MHMWTRAALSAIAVGGIVVATSASAPALAVARLQTPSMRSEIEAMITHSAQTWNRGDLDGFVEDYVEGDRTTYVTPRKILRGRAEIRESYYPRYFAPGAHRDSLSFEGLEVDSLAPTTAHVIAFYVLSRGDSVTSRGPTSLVMLRVKGRWQILHDHSS